MADLETLRPEVRSALGAIVRADVCRDPVPTDAFGIIRAELLRLADECAMIPRVQLLANFAAANERAEKAEAELLRLTDDCARLVDCINAQPPTRRSLIDRAERAEAELAALKARIAEAPEYRCEADIISGRDGDYISAVLIHDDNAFQYPDVDGKRVRLVVEE